VKVLRLACAGYCELVAHAAKYTTASGTLDDAGLEKRKLREVAVAQRQLLDATLIHKVSHRCRRGLYHGRFSSDLHRGAHLADLERMVYHGILADRQRDSAAHAGLEAGKGRADLVAPGLQVRHLIAPALAADRVAGGSRLDVLYDDIRARNRSTGRVCHHSVNRSGSELRQGRSSK